MWGIKRIRLSRLGSCQREKGLEYSLVALTLLPAVGFLVGFLVSLVGGSGGVFYVPLLILGFGVDPRIAVTTSLATMVPTAIIGSLSHREFGNLNVRAGMTFGLSGMCSALLGVYLSSRISTAALEEIIGVVLIGLSIPMAIEAFRRVHSTNQEGTGRSGPRLAKYRSPISISFGAMSGFMSGLLGLSGLSFVVTGMYFLGYSASTVIGTSVFVLLFNTVAGLAGYVWLGQFDLTLILMLSIAASAGAFVAPKVLSRVKGSLLEKVYGPAFVLVLIAFGLTLLLRG
jgi:uncharacterized protein